MLTSVNVAHTHTHTEATTASEAPRKHLFYCQPRVISDFLTLMQISYDSVKQQVRVALRLLQLPARHMSSVGSVGTLTPPGGRLL